MNENYIKTDEENDMTKHQKEILQELSKEQLIYLIEQMKNSLCKIGEACVEESKGHRPPEKAVEDIRGYIFDMPSLVDTERAKRTIDLMRRVINV